MKLESQVCSLELAKRLKELGVKQESVFYFYKGSSKPEPLNAPDVALQRRQPDVFAAYYVSAFTVAELGEMLPDSYFTSRYTDGFSDSHPNKGWHGRNWTTREFHEGGCKTEADARAKMLIYLLENKLMEVPK
jgi:hypothetical protein